MTTATKEFTSPTTRPAVRWSSLAWVAWRQHRVSLLTLIALGAVGTGLMLIVGAAAPISGGFSASGVGDLVTVLSHLLPAAVLCGSGVVAAFWAAPLLSREYEQRTHLLAWGQDVKPARWLLGKSAVLVGTAVALAVVLGLAAQWMIDEHNRSSNLDYPPFPWFDPTVFESAPLIVVGHVLFGFALGLTMSALTHRTLLSMGLTLGVFLAVRFVVMTFLRPYYMTPVRDTSPLGAADGNERLNTMTVEAGLLDAAGRPMEHPDACFTGDYESCIRRAGAVAQYEDFHPASRAGAFQLIEFGLYAGLAAVLAVVVWRLVRRTRSL